ncbi:Basic region leucine zipper [Musa troglodytarum]|uniref:Basic region leucine zipper n=1 Tax=Musa troglodytarum TaxID=320322 RepID=A0A9E7KX64_9LILI|nr:Basic region leucine zipper [Musa troglodytarum]
MATQGVGGRQQSQVQSLARQGSIYSLTLNEVQSHLGEPLHSMNLDELLRSVFPSEEHQSSGADAGGGHGALDPRLHREGSVTMTRVLSKKTIDEVWRHIQQGQEEAQEGVRDYGRQSTLGEMTLEAFLSKAGISIAGAYGGRQLPQPLAIVDAVFHEGEGANSSPVNPQTPRRKRGPVEDTAKKTVERRQKRMIKNRESAARSRARKQASSIDVLAYTNELENKVSRLEEENQRLRQQRELEAMIHHIPQPEPKHQLRRTSSALF